MKKTVKKQLLAIVLIIFITSCLENKKDEKAVSNTSQTSNILNKKNIKIENPNGLTLNLNQEDFKISNGFIYYKENLFTGKINYDISYQSGYFHVNNGIIEGETVTNYKMSGFIRKEYYKQGKLLSFSQKDGEITVEVIYSEKNSDNIAQIVTEYGKNSYLMDFELLKGTIVKDGKVSSNLNVTEKEKGKYISDTFEEDGKTFRIQYYYNDSDDVRLIKYLFDSQDKKFEILNEDRLLSKINFKFDKGLKNFEEVRSLSPEKSELAGVTVPEANQTGESNHQPSQEVSVQSQAPQPSLPPLPQSPTVNDGDDLELLNRVYDEVMNKNNFAILNQFSKEKLGYIRNTVYARRGYIFSNPKYASYFSRKSWYRGISHSESVVSERERKFALILLETEKQR